MDGSSLVLRFRNSVTGVLGTEEHRKLIRQFGSTWWGWWKRRDEESHRELLSNLQVPSTVTLISPAEEIQFTAEVRSVRLGEPPDLNRVPAYYREKANEIPAWFELTEIVAVELDQELLGALSHSLLTLLTPEMIDQLRRGSDVAASSEIESDYNYLLHISDIHLGDDHNFVLPGGQGASTPDPRRANKRISLVEAIRSDLDQLEVRGLAAVVVSGDIVSRCKWNYDLVLGFFSELADAVRVPRSSILLVPGNHDFYRQDEDPSNLDPVNYQHEMAYRGFCSEFHGTRPLAEINRTARISFRKEGFALVLGLLNSARWASVPNFFDYGFVGKEKYQSVLKDMRHLSAEPSVRALVLHHHLVPIQPMEQPGLSPTRPVSLTLDATELMRDAQETGVSLVLHGHQHRADIVKVARLRAGGGSNGLNDEDVYICSGGSCGSSDLPRHQWNAYSLFKFGRTGASCHMRTLDPEDNHHQDIVVVDLPVVPANVP